MAIIDSTNDVTDEYQNVIPYYLYGGGLVDVPALKVLFDAYMLNDKYEYIMTGKSQKIDEFFWDVLLAEMAQLVDTNYTSDYLTATFFDNSYYTGGGTYLIYAHYFTGSIANPSNESTVQYYTTTTDPQSPTLAPNTRIETFALSALHDFIYPASNRINTVNGTKTRLGQSFRIMGGFNVPGNTAVTYQDSLGRCTIDSAYLAKYKEYWGDQQWKSKAQWYGYFCVRGYVPPAGTIAALASNATPANTQITVGRGEHSVEWVRVDAYNYTLTNLKFGTTRAGSVAIAAYDVVNVTATKTNCTSATIAVQRARPVVLNTNLIMTASGYLYYVTIQSIIRDQMTGSIFTGSVTQTPPTITPAINGTKPTWGHDKYRNYGYLSPVPGAVTSIITSHSGINFVITFTTTATGSLNASVTFTVDSGIVMARSEGGS
jgi:hypothetical protein